MRINPPKLFLKPFPSMIYWIGLGSIFLSGCLPRITANYRDFVTQDQPHALEMAQAALQETGWTLAAAPASGVLTTHPRALKDFGVYRLSAQAEVAVLDGRYVRVYLHTFRKYLISGRISKVPYLERNTQTQLLKPLIEALQKRGLTLWKPVWAPENKATSL